VFIRIEPSTDVPIWRQIADQIRSHCASRALSAGDRLPSVRELARQLTVNQNTVLRVYERLTNEGLLERRQGDGTYVAAAVQPANLKIMQMNLLANRAEQLAHRAVTLNVSRQDVHRLIDEAFGRVMPSEGTGRQGEGG
jgi:GntR family transcriptional regulator